MSDVQHVRDAMLPEPGALDATATAQEAGERLAEPAVRAVLVCDNARLVGVITRKTLVREVVAAGRDPRRTHVGEIAEPPRYTLDAAMARTSKDTTAWPWRSGYRPTCESKASTHGRAATRRQSTLSHILCPRPCCLPMPSS